ncbi:helix-turn-helix domain-containing protein [Streptomyces europaeiscabiei]|uniref:helix-turn-helix domain-containing protein n=1 Tax=Streptomyces europaeiscabiei TaxID=146819 RepID=UPI0029BA8A6B|nr:helix-turn-helix transcriptional regulator [Streptomyces europaeiscabiei]MDX2528079.1 helix-turn-helix transcriptional regulator [Streptomyces europaeiscabiei]MDX2757947.1 helix-turn-helix transcriptional regulator [Streptomyces europaeiscabiei]MDX3585944.1 helix-turn-helix transcriptional regulator [Streptomyces europaeiscabiei]MDX3839529.1 helix-turn-helix transcriptional regulator [Streptomyces europaeiscabiei]
MPDQPDPSDDQWLLTERRAIGDRIRIARLHRNLTQERLYLSADVSRAALQSIEAGTSDVRLSTLMRIARALGIHPADLLR